MEARRRRGRPVRLRPGGAGGWPGADRTSIGRAVLPDRGLLEAGTDGVLALPLHVGAVRLNGRPEERAALVAIVRRDGHGGFDCVVRDDDGSLVLRLDGYRTVPLPDPPPEHVVAPIRDVMSG